ncbi:MAG: hypothetical protein SFW36_20195, partial [Leptolyngbyaceae cyanobacterium bins.59]|nr:hypothetical protein [Leptolyngbyaceae cyanobacterium bins.59]
QPRKVVRTISGQRRIRELEDWVEQLAHLYEYLSLDGGTLWECLWANPSNRWVEVGNQLATQGLLKSSLTPQDYCHLREVAAAQVASTTPHPTLTQIYQSLQAVVTDVTSAVAVELQVLANGCYPNPMVLKLLEYVQQRGLKVIILAETDLSADQFAQILQAKGLGDWSDRIFTSSDLGVGKEEGALYQQVADRLGIHPQAMLHIGGDWTLDYQVPSDLKIKATHYPPATPYIDELFERERALLANSGGVSLNSLRVLVSRLDGHIGGDRTPFQCGALLFGSVMARFADWSVEQFQAFGIDRVLTLMPEGILLQQLLETAANQRGILLTCIPCYLNLEQEQAPTYLQSLISGIDRVGVLALGSLNCSIPEVVRVIQSLGVTCLGCTLIAGGQEKKGILEGLDVRAYLGFATESIERSGILEGLTACIEPVEEYRETPTGAIEPIWASSPEHREEWERRQLLQEGVLTFQHLWWSVLKGGDGFDLEAIDRQNQVILNRLVQFPIQREAYLFGAFERHQEPVCREVDFQILRMEGAFGLWQNPDVRWPQGVVAIECPNVVHRWAKSGWPLDRMENEGAWSHYRGGLLPYSPQEVQVLADYLWRYKPTTVFLFSRGISTLSQWFVDTLATLPSGNSPRHLIELGRQEAMGEVQSPPQVEYQRSSENWAEELQQIQRVLEQGKASEPVLLYLDEPGNGWEVNGILQSLTQYLPLSCGVLVSHTRLDTCAMQESQSVWTGAMHWFNTAGMAVGFTLLETPLWIASLWTGFQRGLTTVEFTPFDFNLREINLIAFPDWSQPEEVLDELLSSLILALLSRPDRDRITLLIDSSQANVEEADLLLSSLLMQLMLEQEIDLADLEISLTGSLQPQDWQSLLPHIHARIPLTWENPQAIVAANATILPLFS